ncbi:MAG: immunoglobulin domain-containing protein [Verrucomicrobia bacterium]|nr:immunoglobulin domain-containing protein [Verrucomicrobiota bacterium]
MPRIEAQAPPLDTFNPQVSGRVNAIAVQPDGKVILGGNYLLISDRARSWLGRFQPDGALDAPFAPVLNREAISVAIQPDGKILVGGPFSTVNGQPRIGLCRLNPDGSLDEAFNPTGLTEASVIALQPDGKILVGQPATIVAGVGVSEILRLHPDGNLDATFDAVANGNVNSIVIQPDGRVVIGGAFTQVNGRPRQRLARLEADGRLDLNFTPAANSTVLCLGIQPDGKILAGGAFTTLAGQPRTQIGRLESNGTLDPGFAPVIGGTNPLVRSFGLLTDGSLIVVGRFSTLGGQPHPNIGRLLADGSVDDSFTTGVTQEVTSVAVQTDGRILVGGTLLEIGGTVQQGVARLQSPAPATQSLTFTGDTINWMRGGTSPEISRASFEAATDGTDWTVLGPGERVAGGWQLVGATIPPNAMIRARGPVSSGLYNGSQWLAEAYAGRLQIVAQPESHTNVAGSTAKFRIVAAGSLPIQYQWTKGGIPLTDGPKLAGTQTATLSVLDVRKADEGEYICEVTDGETTLTSALAVLAVVEPVISSQPVGQVAEPGQTLTLSVTAVGTEPLAYQWSKDGQPIANATSAELVLANAQVSDSGLYSVVVSNSFGTVTSAVAEVIVTAAIPDPTFTGSTSVGNMTALAIQSDDRILVAGNFSILSGNTRPFLGRLLPDGAFDGTFNPGNISGTLSPVNSVVVQPDGRILVGGSFTEIAGQTVSALVRLNQDGSREAQFSALLEGQAPIVRALALDQDGTIIVGGAFTSVGGEPHTNIVRLNPDGSVVSGFTPSVSTEVLCLALQPDGKILVGGRRFVVGGETRDGLARLNADGSLDAAFRPSAPGGVFSLALQADGKILLGGDFVTVNGVARQRIARVNSNGTLDTTFNPGANGSVQSLAVQADGAIIIAGNFTQLGGARRNGIGRLLSNGTVDPAFNPKANGAVQALALQKDGKVLVAGAFSQIGGLLSQGLDRLQNSAPATANLSYGAGKITWLRGGTQPEVWRTAFELSSDGVTWTDLGAGTRIPGGWEAPLVVTNPGPTIRVRGFATGGLGGASGWHVESQLTLTGPIAPWIVQPPASRTIFIGSGTTLTVDALGTAPLTYQWYRGPAGDTDNPIPGATAATYSTPPLLTNTQYWVRVSNAGGSVDSETADITTIPVPAAITLQPGSQTIFIGESATLEVQATGTPPLSYQWYVGPSGDTNQPIAGATSPSYTTPELLATTEYWVRVSNAGGIANSETATITAVPVPPAVTKHPDSETINAGQTVTLAVQATGTPPLSYQWYIGPTGDTSNPIAGATEATYTTPPLEDTILVWVRVSNAGGTADSEAATITVAPVAPFITRHPASQTIVAGQTATMTVEATGSRPLSYQWFVGTAGTTDNPIAGATSASYTTPALSTTTRYWVRVTNPGGAANSVTATITVTPGPPTITKHPENQTINAGQTATLSVEAAGTPPLSYQWYRGPSGATGDPIAGATSATFTTAPLNATTEYWVRVSNERGSADSQTATVSVSAATPPLLQATGVQGGKLILTATGAAGSRWRVLSSTNLVQWQAESGVGVVVLGSGPTTIEIPIGAAAMSFYRLVNE